MDKINLEAYFHRIGYNAIPLVNLQTLRALQELHTQTIPFENLSPLFGIPVKLDIKSLQQKMITEKRGGYCFEQNNLFRDVLETIGFQVKCLEARVVFNNSSDRLPARTHMLLLVTLDENIFIVDVGFGGMTPTMPLLLKTGVRQETTLEPFRLIYDSDHYILEAFVQENWKPLYHFDLQQQFLIDYELKNWFVATNPASHFLTNLMISRTANECRYALMNNQFSVHNLKKGTEKKILITVKEFREVLEDTFLLSLPDHEDLDKKLEKLIEMNQQDG
ncbi:MAG TPA: arylamine N-acetyltransferase [Hanamia sp.]|nr:arylamine N-acetyltransferase [Hanamia sp.]